ncbi:MAG: glycosyltransferase family 2 protein [Phycisphaerae bacterium]
MSRDPLVSVIIPTYNRATLLPRALESVLFQSIDDWEVIVVDDGSIDDTPEIVRHLAPSFGGRLVYERQSNRGSSAARNRGIDLARGRFVCFLDSDDEFVPNKIERQLTLFSQRPELGLVYSDFLAKGIDGESLGCAFDRNCRVARSVSTTSVGDGLFVCGDDMFSSLLSSYFIATIVGMVRRDVLGETIRFEESASYAEEWLFYLTVVRACAVGFVDEPLSIHHHTSGSVTRTDTFQNVAGAYSIVRRVASVFRQLTPVQRRHLHREMARTALQMGYDTSRRGRPRDAVRYYREAFAHEKSWHTGRALVSGLWQAASRSLATGEPMVDTSSGGKA